MESSTRTQLKKEWVSPSWNLIEPFSPIKYSIFSWGKYIKVFPMRSWPRHSKTELIIWLRSLNLNSLFWWREIASKSRPVKASSESIWRKEEPWIKVGRRKANGVATVSFKKRAATFALISWRSWCTTRRILWTTLILDGLSDRIKSKRD